MKINMHTIRTLLNFGQRAYKEYQRIQRQSERDNAASQSHPPSRGKTTRNSSNGTSNRQVYPQSNQGAGSAYPGDFTGRVHPEYSPNPGGNPDPGEVVWTWVPYEEDFSQGKDRPVLLIGHDGQYLLALMLTSKDNTNPHHKDTHYLDIGSGPWDKQGRASEVKLNRIIRVRPEAVRREGAIMPQATFNMIINALHQQ